MKTFTNNSIWKKIVIALLIILLFQTVIMRPVHADVVEFAGKLTSPILSLLVTLSDGINDIIARVIMGANTTLYQIDMADDWWQILGTIIVAVAAAALTIVAVVATAGLAAVALSAVGITATVTVGVGTVIAGVGAGILSAVWFNDQVLPDDLYLPMYTYSAEEIFKGNILLFDVDFFNKAPEIKEHKDGEGKIDYYYYINEDGKEVKTSNQNSAVMLKNTISSWYNALRNICLVLMLSVLVYIGIRMLLSSVASDKAKYLTMLKDWFIGLCLLFLMHYIMAFSVTIVEKITDVVKTAVDEDAYVVVIEANDEIEKQLDKDHLNQPDAIQKGEDGKKYLNWPTNLMGSLRLQLQMEQYGAQYVGLCICFLMLCLFTLYFTIIYLKRVLYMAFLTLIAPLVALTYCIDKINDGQAQGFNKWFREYIFNLLIQPMHLLLYYILVTSAFELASTNVIYSIVAIGFMIPAEKLLRSLFGFEKAQTPPILGPAGAMMASQGLSKLLHRVGPGGNAGKGNSNTDSVESNKFPGSSHESDPIEPWLRDGGYNDNSNDVLQDNQGAGNDELDDNGQAWLNYAEDPNNFMDTSPMLQQNNDGDIREQDFVKDSNSIELPKEDQPNRMQENLENEDSRRRKLKRAVQRKAHAYKAVGKLALRKGVQSGVQNFPRTVGKMATGTALGAAAGAVGLAIGATTGDLSNVAKIGVGSAVTGFSLGSGVGDASLNDEYKNAYDEAYNSSEYKEEALQDYAKKYRGDPEVRNYLEQKVGNKEAKKMLEKGGEVEQYLNNNITDKKEMATLHKLQKEGVVKDTDEAISISQLGQLIGANPDNMKAKDRKEWKTTISNMAKKKGINNTEKFTEDRFKQIGKYYDFKK